MSLFNSFGKNPAGKELSAINRSAQFSHGEFHNISPTEMMTGDASMLRMTWKFLNKPRNTAPPAPLPSVKTDLNNLSANQPALVWFGHSSYLLHIDGKNILVDPVMSGHASPFIIGAHSFPGSDAYTPDEMPVIDVLLITHDHYDHLDHRTLLKLKPKIRSVVTSLGVSAHLISWGFDPQLITELDWGETATVAGAIQLTAAPARHFSGRTLKRNRTLWSSFVLRSSQHKIYIGGDSGYDTHFKSIGSQYGPFDLAILETGQYNPDWSTIHMMPEETVQACIDLNARLLLPVHWAKFALAFHPWDEPVKRVLKKAAEMNIAVTTPQIGEPVIITGPYPVSKWWEKL